MLAGMGWLLWIYAWVVSGVVLRTLATRGRKRAGPTPQVWEGCSAAEGPKDNTACDHPAKQQLCAWGDGAKRKVRRTIHFTATPSYRNNEAQSSRARARWETARAKHGGRQLARNTVGGSSREARWESGRTEHGGRQLARNTVVGSSREARWETGRTNTIRRLTAETK